MLFSLLYRRGAGIVVGATTATAALGVTTISSWCSKEEEKLRKISSSLELIAARAIADGVLEKGREVGLLPLAVVVLDAGGKDVVVLREDNCGNMRCEIARGKANAALAMGMSSRQIRDRLKDRPFFYWCTF
mmetsp:Transcript_10880/g.16389  ORF Transcript_10880/g.16389 Transcript_10880/m.16389 type:complete len:132 (-) Transcript_10880:1494-1889(-)